MSSWWLSTRENPRPSCVNPVLCMYVRVLKSERSLSGKIHLCCLIRPADIENGRRKIKKNPRGLRTLTRINQAQQGSIVWSKICPQFFLFACVYWSAYKKIFFIKYSSCVHMKSVIQVKNRKQDSWLLPRRGFWLFLFSVSIALLDWQSLREEQCHLLGLSVSKS